MAEYYLFPYQKITPGERVVIYGAGKVGREYIEQIALNHYCEIGMIVAEELGKGTALDGYCVGAPEELNEYNDYDHIILATMKEQFRREMNEKLLQMGVPQDKIIHSLNHIYREPYAQHGEDMIIYQALRHMGYFREGKLPSYIDVGAHHPYELSNTAMFYRLGCRGVNIEANPDLIKAFERERPEDINLCFGIGGKEGEFPFYITEEAGLNTFRRENIEYNERLVERDEGRKTSYPVKETRMIPIRRLPDVIEQYCGGVYPTFMSMDIEGMEYESLEICDLTDGPSIMEIEVNYDGDRFVEMLEKQGYFPYLWMRENIIFIKEKYRKYVHAHDRRG